MNDLGLLLRSSSKAEDARKAIEVYQAALHSEPDTFSVLVNLAVALGEVDMTNPKIFELYERAIDLVSESDNKMRAVLLHNYAGS